jgi:signal transduction histidine kinase
MNSEKKPQTAIRSMTAIGNTDKVIRSLYLGLLVLLGLLITFFIAQYATNQLETHTRQLLRLDNDLTDLLSIVQNAETGQRGFLLTGKPYYLEPFYKSREKSAEVIDRMKASSNEGLLTLSEIDEVQGLISRKFSEMERTIRLERQGKSAKALAVIETDLGNDLMDEIRLHLSNLREIHSEESRKKEATIRKVNIVSLLIVSTAVLVLIFVFYRIYDALQPLLDKIRLSYQELKTSRVSLESKNKELEHFAYIASHDLNEPLRTINSFVGILKEEHQGDFSKEVKQYFEFIDNATTRMRGLIDGLLNYSRIGKSDTFQAHDLNLILRDLRQDLTRLIEDNEAIVKVDPLPTIVCLRTEIRQLFQNLLANALKFAAEDRPPIVAISFRELPTHWEFCVADNGIGIDPAQQHKIFGAFSRLHLASQYEGQGIGLAFSKKIVEIHQGEIWVDSSLGEGSRFYFTIKKNLADENKA